MSSKKHTILIAGASGVVGMAATEYFASLPDWQVMALSRRPVSLPDGVVHVPVDLCDLTACESAAANLTGVTHVLFAALYELPELVAGWRDPRQMAVNEAMLKNLLDALTPKAKGLRHITILQGTKAYGGHVEPAPVPAKERWPRHWHENFYWLQEDLLRTRQPESSWTFSILRPQIRSVESHEYRAGNWCLCSLDAGNGAALEFPWWGAMRQCRKRQPADRASRALYSNP